MNWAMEAAVISLTYKDCPEVVEKIDCLVLARRHQNPGGSYSRAAFLREAVNRALAGVEVTVPKVRTRARESLAAVKPVALAAGVRG